MSKKSYKREIAFGLLALWVVLVVRVFFASADPKDLGDILIGLTPWIVPPVLAVFGFHAHLNKDKDDGGTT